MGRDVKISWVGVQNIMDKSPKGVNMDLFFSENTGGYQNYLYQECIFVDRNYTHKKLEAQRYHKWSCFLISSETIRPFGIKLSRNVH